MRHILRTRRVSHYGKDYVLRYQNIVSSVKVPVRQSGNILRSGRILIISVWKISELTQTSSNAEISRENTEGS